VHSLELASSFVEFLPNARAATKNSDNGGAETLQMRQKLKIKCGFPALKAAA